MVAGSSSGNSAARGAIPIRNREELAEMAKAGRVAAQLRRELGKRVVPGVSTMELNLFAEQYMHDRGASPAQKGYHGYPYAICAAVNECVCHGMPGGRLLRDGDIVTLDFVVELNGWMADTAWTYAVGNITPEAKRLRKAAFQAMMSGIEQVRPGRTIGDIAAAVGRVANDSGSYGIVSQFGGHGIGRAMHEPPEVSYVGRARTGRKLKEGMVITIEPMLTIGSPEVYIAEDGWTVITEDGGLAAQFEHTVAVTTEGPVILTH
ncbi:type I methionyl aminopeptidase [Cohnella silvisoli]|uniref:Methionine aminopeptidase n=1 Tax=Cohnella silvisoli TaxID=2873699 RepID=A0ABV1KLZ4_9BACL|nr:type I methionyl aminopeptidase [Cohnella silvisoli]MCD9020548.1 type I methionyl aminopeptidase [Cohnella silvisoli]